MGECDRDVKGVPSIGKVIRSAGVLVRMLPILDMSCEENTARRKWKSPLFDSGNWTPEDVEKWSVSRWGKNRRRTNSLCSLPDVLGIGGIKEMTWGEFYSCFLVQLFLFMSLAKVDVSRWACRNSKRRKLKSVINAAWRINCKRHKGDRVQSINYNCLLWIAG